MLARSTIAAVIALAALTIASGFSQALSDEQRLPIARLQSNKQAQSVSQLPNAAPMGCAEACVKTHELCVQKKEKSEVECYADMNKCLVACQINR